MPEQELNQCPKCGGEAEIMEDLVMIWVACTECALDTGECTSDQEAVEIWNS